MDLYFRDFDPRSPVTSGGKWLAALAARIGLAFVYALPHTDLKRRLLLSARQLWVLCLLLAAWLALSIFPATAELASIVNGILFALGALSLLDRIKEVGGSLADGLKAAYEARTDEELEQAGKLLAPALSAGALTALEVLVSYGAFRAVEAAAAGRFPMPEWFEARFRKAQERTAGTEPKATEPNEAASKRDTAKADPKRPAEQPKAAEQPKRPAEKSPLETAAKVAGGAIRLEGGRRAAEELSDFPVVPVALAVGTVVAAAAAVAFSRGGRR